MTVRVETWPTNAALTSTNQDLTYTAVNGTLGHTAISGGIATIVRNGDTSQVYNFGTTEEVDDVDSYAFGKDFSQSLGVGGQSLQVWVGCRGNTPSFAATFYLAMADKNGGGIQLRKSISSVRSDLTSPTTYPSEPFDMGVQADGDQISGLGALSSHGPVTDGDISVGLRGYIGGFSSRVVNTSSIGEWEFGDIPTLEPIELDHLDASATFHSPTVEDTGGFPYPENLQAVAVSDTRIDLSWDAVDGADAYALRRDSVIIANKITATTYQDDDLVQGTEYEYNVRAARVP